MTDRRLVGLAGLVLIGLTACGGGSKSSSPNESKPDESGGPGTYVGDLYTGPTLFDPDAETKSTGGTLRVHLTDKAIDDARIAKTQAVQKRYGEPELRFVKVDVDLTNAKNAKGLFWPELSVVLKNGKTVTANFPFNVMAKAPDDAPSTEYNEVNVDLYNSWLDEKSKLLPGAKASAIYAFEKPFDLASVKSVHATPGDEPLERQ